MSNRLQDLIAKRAELEQQIIDLQREERSSAIAQVKALMAQHGLTAADLGSARASSVASTSRAAKSGGGAKVPAKYRNAATGDTWSGRGLQPNWLKKALADGAKLTDFAL